MLGILWNDFWG